MSVFSLRIAQKFNGSHYNGQATAGGAPSLHSRHGSILSKGSKFSARSNISKLSKLQKRLIEEHEADRVALNRSKSDYQQVRQGGEDTGALHPKYSLNYKKKRSLQSL